MGAAPTKRAEGEYDEKPIIKRGETGCGQFVDTSLYEAGITHTFWQSAIFMASGVLPEAMGSAHPLMAPYQAFETADGWINLGSANQNLWQKLTELLGATELAEDARFAEPNARRDNHLELAEALNGYFRGASTDEWFAKLDAAGIPAGPVLDIAEMTEDAQTNARGMVQEVGGDAGEAIRVLGHPVKYSEHPAAITRPAPALGEHTEEVLLEAGYSEAEIAGFREAGVIGTGEGS